MLMSAGLLGCEGGTFTPPLIRQIEVRIDDGGAYFGGLLSLQGRSYALARGPAGLHTVVEAAVGEGVESELELYKQELQEGEQSTLSFDRSSTRFTPRARGVDLTLADLDQPIAMVRLSRMGVHAELLEDPCILTTRITGGSQAVDADRALYRGGFDELITFAFTQTQAYDGGELWADGSDHSAYRSECEGGRWTHADTLVCSVSADTLLCLYHAWER